MQIDVKKQYFMIKEAGSWYNVTADLTKNVVLGFKVIRRVVSLDGTKNITGWMDYGDEMLVGYDANGQHIEKNGENDFYLFHAGLWHWTILDENKDQLHGKVGLPKTGFYNDPVTKERIPVRYQYTVRETGVYSDLNRNPYPNWQWYTSMVPDRYWDSDGKQVSGEFGLAFPNHDGERVVNYQATNLLVDKRWLGEPNVKQVYLKIYRRAGEDGELEDFTALMADDAAGRYPENHPAHGNQNWQHFVDDPSSVDTNRSLLILKSNKDGDWTTTMNVQAVLLQKLGASDRYYYYVQEVGYQDKNGVDHLLPNSVDPENAYSLVFDTTGKLTELAPHYTKWVGGVNGGWQTSNSKEPEDMTISLGMTGENKLQVMNSPLMDLTVEKKWYNDRGEEIDPWMTSIKFQIEQQREKYINGVATGIKEKANVVIGGQSTFTITGEANNPHWDIEVDKSDRARYTKKATSTDDSPAWTFYIDGLQEGFFDAQGNEWHCVYHIKEINAIKSDVVIKGNDVSTDGKTVTIENTKTDTSSVKITKSFSGIPALPDDFVINVNYTDGNNDPQSFALSPYGTQPPNVVLSGEGTPDNPYVWTISKIATGSDVVATITEENYTVEQYSVTVDGKDPEGNTTKTIEIVDTAINKDGFVNDYTRATGNLRLSKVVKAVTVNDEGAEIGEGVVITRTEAAESETLFDGRYRFMVIDSNGEQAEDADGNLVPIQEIDVVNGVSEVLEVVRLIPGTYTVAEVGTDNKVVDANFEPVTVVVESGKTSDAAPLASITNKLKMVTVQADKKWVNGNDTELEEWPSGATATFGVYAGTSTTPLAQVELDGTADAPIPPDGDTPVGYEANKEGKDSGGGLAIFKNLPQKDKNGKTIVYTIKEIGEPEGFVNLTPDGVANGGTITNKQNEQKGSLKLTKLVTVNGHSTITNLADGAYVFSIAGPDTDTTVVKYVQITVTGGKAASYKVVDGPTKPEEWTEVEITETFESEATARDAIVSDLAAGDYVITETAVHNMTTKVSGGKEEKDKEESNSITVTVTAGETVDAKAQATFTNNKDVSDITVKKKVIDYNDSSETPYEPLYSSGEKTYNDSADHDIGDPIVYQVHGTVPEDIADFTKYSYEFEDQMTHLTYVADSYSVVVHERKRDETSGQISFANYDVSSYFTPSWDPETKVLKVTANGDGIKTITSAKEVDNWSRGTEAGDVDKFPNAAPTTTGDDVTIDPDCFTYFELRYEATLDDDAVPGNTGNPNLVKINHSTNLDGTGTDSTPQDKNKVFTYALEINKIKEDGQPLDGATFTLEKKNSSGGWDPVPATRLTSTPANKPTKFVWTGIDDGVYQLTETAPDGYRAIGPIEFTVTALHDSLKDDPQLISLTATATESKYQGFFKDSNHETLGSGVLTSGTIVADILNLPNEIKIIKIDGETAEEETPTKLQNAVFELYRCTINEGKAVKGVKVSSVTTDENGEASFSNLEAPEGVVEYLYYWIEETTAPDGYQRIEDPIIIAVDKDNEITMYVYDEESGWMPAQNERDASGNVPGTSSSCTFTTTTVNRENPKTVSITYTIGNTPYKTPVKVVKVDSENRTTPLTGARFRLLKWNSTVPSNVSEEVFYSGVKGADGAEEGVLVNDVGELTFANLLDGEYKIVETKTPDGYIKIENNDIYFTMKNGVVTRHPKPEVVEEEVSNPDVSGETIKVPKINWGNEIAVDAPVNSITYTKATKATDSDPAQDATFTVGNQKGAALPSTGGPGTTGLYVLGSILTLMAAVLLITKKRSDAAGID